MPLPTIGFAGMTHLGLNSAVAGAERGFEMVCFDLDKNTIEELLSGHPPVEEPDLKELMVKHKDRIRFTSNIEELANCDVVYVAPDIPTDDMGQSDLTVVNELLQAVDDALPISSVLVVLSQVPPGFSRGLNLREGRSYYYQVETLIFGRAIERALYPERYIIGCADPSKPLEASYEAFLSAHECPLLPMRYESAELAKISINCCLVASVSVANTLAELCENIGADWSEIVPALKLDRRIGQYSYLSPGLGISGGNLERDLTTVCEFSDKFGTDSGIVKACIANSRYRKDWVLRLLHQEVFSFLENPKFAVLGLSYKENTHSTKNSPSLALLKYLKDFEVAVHDPVVSANVLPNLDLRQVEEPVETCDGADVLIIMTPWPIYRNLKPSDLLKSMRTKMIIDPYRVLGGEACRVAGARYFTLGVNDL